MTKEFSRREFLGIAGTGQNTALSKSDITPRITQIDRRLFLKAGVISVSAMVVSSCTSPTNEATQEVVVVPSSPPTLVPTKTSEPTSIPVTDTPEPTPTEVPTERPFEQPLEEETTHSREIINGDWITEAEGKFGTTMRLMVSEQLRREGFLSLEFTTVQLMDEFHKNEGGLLEYKKGSVQRLADSIPSWRVNPEQKANEIVSGLLDVEEEIPNLLELGLLRIIYERGLNVGFGGGAEYSDFETYCFSVLGAKISGNGSAVSVPLPNGEMIDPTKPITIAVIDSSEVEKARQLTPEGYETDVRWTRRPTLYRTGLDGQGGLVFVWEISSENKSFLKRFSHEGRRGDAVTQAQEIMEEGLINIHTSEFPNYPIDGIWQAYPTVANQVRRDYMGPAVADGPNGKQFRFSVLAFCDWSEVVDMGLASNE